MPIGEVGVYLAMAVAATSLLRTLKEWRQKRRYAEFRDWFRQFTKPGEEGDEHFGMMMERWMKGREE